MKHHVLELPSELGKDNFAMHIFVAFFCDTLGKICNPFQTYCSIVDLETSVGLLAPRDLILELIFKI